MLTVNENEYVIRIEVSDDEKISENRVLVTFSFLLTKLEKKLLRTLANFAA